MCGIFAAFNYHGDVSAYRQRALQLSKKIRHRGPDWSGCIISGRHIFCHERLSIVGIQSGALEPLTNEDKSIILTVNGEIYNHKSLRRRIRVANPEVKFKTQSDCEVILHLYQQIGDDVVNHLDGVFSFVLYDVNSDRLIAARDAIGVTTLYYGFKKSPENGSGATTETIYFASEMKSLREECYRILSFPPGHIYDSKTGEIRRWYNPKWFNEERIPTTPVNYHELRVTLERAVRKRLMSEVPFGVLLSGGLDSSLIAAIAAREITQINSGSGPSDDEEEFDESALFSWPRLHSFSIGLPGSPDLLAAREVATYLGTIHHENTFTIQEGLDAISDVIYHLETYDVTTVRASTPMYLLSRKIKAMGVKMVLSGEGSDEIFGGYLYFHQAPDAESLHKETVARVKNLHTSDCLRANKSTMAWGLEARVPFLDKTFLDVSMSIDPREKMSTPERMEKYILRKAFDITKEDEDEGQKPYLPSSILWRQKEQFSDGVGYSWIDSLKLEAEGLVSDEKFENRANRWPNDTPTTKEAYWYREAFEKWFPEEACIESIVRWIPRKDWGCSEDPSGRAQKVHCEAYDKKQEE